MPSCEKCWADSRGMSDHADETAYQRLRMERELSGQVCTAEEQAGPDATECGECGRMTAHQHCQVCMACGYDPRAQPQEGE